MNSSVPLKKLFIPSILFFLAPLSFTYAEFVSTPDTNSAGTRTLSGYAITATTTRVYVGTSNNGYAVSRSDNSSITDFVTSVADGNGPSIRSVALSPDGQTLYIGGQFGTVNGIAHNRIAAINTSTGAASTTWTFTGVDGFYQIYSLAISPNGRIIYIGGAFNTINGVPYNNLAALDAYTGEVISSFNPNVDSTVFALKLSADGNTLYTGGQFTSVGGVP